MNKKEENFFICPHCHLAFMTENMDFFNHISICEEMDHSDSPITIRWYTKKELIEKERKKMEAKKEVEVNSYIRPVTR
ncbi:MAG: hypothetical protein CML42_07980 [Rhodobacteraceae bacterium]|nr:hypothetical protein [Paracoccaceae bacterium]|tara:strand:- start:15391 stop:15624 length:234 start_codon:yes stop_codon:yes gene_type:complete